MQQQAALVAAAGQGPYLTPVTLAQIPHAVTALPAPNGITSTAMTPTTASLANGEYSKCVIFFTFTLTLSLKTNCRPFQIERVCRRQF